MAELTKVPRTNMRNYVHYISSRKRRTAHGQISGPISNAKFDYKNDPGTWNNTNAAMSPIDAPIHVGSIVIKDPSSYNFLRNI